MPYICFEPKGKKIEVPTGLSILVSSIKNKISLNYGCAACQCGTCAIMLTVEGKVSKMETHEQKLLDRMSLPTDGSIRLACQVKVLEGTVTVDLSFQQKYSPDKGIL